MTIVGKISTGELARKAIFDARMVEAHMNDFYRVSAGTEGAALDLRMAYRRAEALQSAAAQIIINLRQIETVKAELASEAL